MQRMYFGRPINTYDEPISTRLIQKILEEFPGWEIEDPNQPCHQDGYKEYVKRTGKGMDYYYIEVLPNCDGGVFLPFPDGSWGAGVYGEASFLQAHHRPVYQITPSGIITPAELSRVRALTIDETRARIRTPDNKLIPY